MSETAPEKTPEEMRQFLLGVVKGWSRRFPHPDLEAIARHFIAYYTKGGGCSNCGGLPHTTDCFVGRFESALKPVAAMTAEETRATSLLCPKCDGFTVEHTLQYVNELTTQRDKLLTVLATYGKHRAGCASGWRAATGSSQIGECDCGLVAAVANAVRK